MKQDKDGDKATGLNDLTRLFQEYRRRDWELWAIVAILGGVFSAGMLVVYYASGVTTASAHWTILQFSWWVLLALVTLVVLVNVHLINSKRKQLKRLGYFLLRVGQEEVARQQYALDPLTEVYSRRIFEEVISHEARRCDRVGRPLSFLLIEIRDFKQINRELGHLVADELLKAVASLLQEAVRTSDYVFRFGGDDFMLALPETTPEGAAVVEGRVRQRLQQNNVLQQLRRPFEVITACATYRRGMDLAAVVEQADRAVYSQRSIARVP